MVTSADLPKVIHPIQAGYLRKLPIDGWGRTKRRYFVLSRDSLLYYYEQQGEPEPHGILQLHDAGGVSPDPARGTACFVVHEVSKVGESDSSAAQLFDLHLEAPDVDTANVWMKSFKAVDRLTRSKRERKTASASSRAPSSGSGRLQTFVSAPAAPGESTPGHVYGANMVASLAQAAAAGVSIGSIGSNSNNNNTVADTRAKYLGLNSDGKKRKKLTREKLVQKRVRVLMEIAASEERYVADLADCISIYLDPLNARGEEEDRKAASSWFGLGNKKHSLCTSGESEILFSNIAQIHALNTQLLADLRRVVPADDAAQQQLLNSDDATVTAKSIAVSDVFIKFSPFMLIYLAYANNYRASVSTLTRLKQNNKAFETWIGKQHIEAAMSGKKNAQPLGSYLIMPVQRLMRYSLLLTELAKNTDPSHDDWDKLKLALGKVRVVAAKVDRGSGSKQRRASKILQAQAMRLEESRILSMTSYADAVGREPANRVAATSSTKGGKRTDKVFVRAVTTRSVKSDPDSLLVPDVRGEGREREHMEKKEGEQMSAMEIAMRRRSAQDLRASFNRRRSLVRAAMRLQSDARLASQARYRQVATTAARVSVIAAAAARANSRENSRGDSLEDQATARSARTLHFQQVSAARARAKVLALDRLARKREEEALVRDAELDARLKASRPPPTLTSTKVEARGTAQEVVVKTFSDGSSTTFKKATGVTVTRYRNGVRVYLFKDGVELRREPDGTKIQTATNGTTLTVRPDGSRSQVNPGGSETHTRADGTKVTTHPSGVTIIKRPDGGRTQTNADGSTINWDADGTKRTTYSDGTIKTNYPNGLWSQVNVAGVQITKRLDGVMVQKDPDGTIIYVYEDGGRFEKHPDDSVVETSPDGLKVLTTAGGKQYVLDENDQLTNKPIPPGFGNRHEDEDGAEMIGNGSTGTKVPTTSIPPARAPELGKGISRHI